VLSATVLASGIATLDASVAGIALPTIGRSFHADTADLQWVVDAYTLTLAGLLLLGGTLGDRNGRRASFREDDRARAIGARSGLGGVATAIGPFLGGWLISAASWRLVFFINLPIVAAVVLISRRYVPESMAPFPRRKLDKTGAITISLGLAGLTYGLIAASGNGGWTAPQVLIGLAIGMVLFAAFLVTERRTADPMLPLAIFRTRQFSAANAVTFVVYGALGGTLFLVPVVLQNGCGYSALESGAALLPLTAIALSLSSRSGALAVKIGPRLPMTAGPLVMAVGMALFARIHGNGDYLTQVLPAVVVFALGTTVMVAPLTMTAMSAAPAEHSGIASAVNNGVARTASLIAVAVLPVVGGITGDAYNDPATLLRGFHLAVLISAVAAVAGGMLAGAAIRDPSPEQTPVTPTGTPGTTAPHGRVRPAK
jgi:MFS family permease